ncbi:S-layer homology domain-containing protein [Bacillus sp. FJAT-52991]|uniref:S-layer homology domain-containing protein n=1 Tax=Bacillus kandeliae TaxID=3129297 RepID=A0ABZ2N634_9BACI
MNRKPKSYRKFMAASAAVTLMASAVTPVASAAFSDVPSAYKEAVDYLVKEGITSGYPNGEFGTHKQIKRVDMAIMLAKALKLNTKTAPDSGFTDVPSRGVGAVNALKAAGLVNGKTAKSFGSDLPMTRGEMALILTKAYNLTGTAELKFTDVSPRYDKAVQALVANNITNGQSATKFGTQNPITRGEFALFLYRADNLNKTPDLEVRNVIALSKNSVQVTFNKAVDSATASNFSIAGGTVKSVSLNSTGTVATLEVAELMDAKEYTIYFNGLKSEGKPATLPSQTFKTPEAVVKQWELKASAGTSSLLADGKSSTDITYQLVDAKTGAVDTNADNISIDVESTKGSLSSSRITLQDGTAKVKLTSPVSTTDVTASVTGKIAQATGDYSHLVGKTAGTVSVVFKKPAETPGQVPVLTSASSSQADRLTLVFDRDIKLSSLVQTNSKGELLYTIDGKSGEFTKDKIPSDVQAGAIHHYLYNNSLVVKQNNAEKKVLGLKPVPGNSKAIEVILEKSAGKLTNNQAVDIEVSPKNEDGQSVKSSMRFYLTDAKKPEAISAQAIGQNQVKVNFSETVEAANFKIDAQYTSDKFDIKYGEFNPATLEDDRHTALLTLNSNYNEGTSDSKPGYFTSGQHKVEVSSIQDMVGNTGGTKNLDFTVAANATKPTASVRVESPEQFRVTFNTPVNLDEVKAALKLQKYDASTKTYKDDTTDFEVTKVPNKNEYIVELKQDWKAINGSAYNYTSDKYQLFIPANSISNTANGVKNADISLNLNYSGSPLNTLDTRKPALTSIERTDDPNTFIITMDEPVKLPGKDNAGDTLSDGKSLPDVKVVFTGKNSSGNVATVEGTIIDYVDDGSDTKFKVTAGLQSLVNNEGYNSSWTVVVKNITDDVGNETAETTPRSLTINKQANNVDFKFLEVTGKAGLPNDTITLTFSEGVQYRGGANDATVPSVYTLNGSTLPDGTTISVADNDNNTANGLEKVIISLPVNTLKNASNVITVKKGLQSHDGSVLIGENSRDFTPGQ